MARWARACGAIGLALAVLVAAPGEARAQGPRAVAGGGAAIAEAKRLNAEAVRLYGEGSYAKATPFAEQALALRERALGPAHPAVGASLANLATLYVAQGAHEKAEPLYLRALGILENTLGLEHPAFATLLNCLAELYRSQGAYDKAEPLYLRALSIHEKTLGPGHHDVAIILNNLATLYCARGAYEYAEPLLLRSLDIKEKVLGREHPAVATSINNLAEWYRSQSAYDKAEPLYLRALGLWEKRLGREHPALAHSLNGLATLYQEQGAYDKAEPLYLRALGILERTLGREHPLVATALGNLAGLYREQGAYEKVMPLLTRAMALRERQLGAQLGVLPETRKYHLLFTARAEAQVVVSFHAHHVSDSAEALRLALTATLEHKGRVLDELADAGQSSQQNLTPEQRAEFDALTAKRAELAALHDTARPEQAEAVWTLEDEVDQREAELARKSTTFRAQATPVTVEQVRATLPDDAALVEFVRYYRFDSKGGTGRWKEARYVAYVLRREGPPRWAALGEAEPIERAVRTAREALARPAEDARAPLRALDERLLVPLRRALGGDLPRHLLIAPDGALHTVPFGALIDERGKYLLERSLVTLLGSGRDLLRLREQLPPRSGPLVLAAPDFAPGPQPFATLRGALAEAEAVRALFPDASVATGARATRQALLGARAPRFVLLATHGFLQHPGLSPDTTPTAEAPPTVPPALDTRGMSVSLTPMPPGERIHPERALERVGLAFAGANARRDAVASGRDLAGLDLHGTQLVVLSACETGLGQIADGEGVYGLRRALAIAGAESQVVSLWNVNDASSAALMGAYFGALRDGVGRSEALRRAQLGLLRQERYRHPYYWAAFVASGDWRPLEGEAMVPKVQRDRTCACRAAGAKEGASGEGAAAVALLMLVGSARRRAQSAGRL